MMMNIEDVRSLWESKPYSRFVWAYHGSSTINKDAYDVLIKDFISLVEQEYPDFYHDWDLHSLLIFDSLQALCVSFLRQRCIIAHPLSSHVAPLIYHIRLLKLCLHDWADEGHLCIDEEASEMFSWYCHAHKHHFLMDFAPYEYHMEITDWRAALKDAWHSFLEYCKRGAHALGE